MGIPPIKVLHNITYTPENVFVLTHQNTSIMSFLEENNIVHIKSECSIESED